MWEKIEDANDCEWQPRNTICVIGSIIFRVEQIGLICSLNRLLGDFFHDRSFQFDTRSIGISTEFVCFENTKTAIE